MENNHEYLILKKEFDEMNGFVERLMSQVGKNKELQLEQNERREELIGQMRGDLSLYQEQNGVLVGDLEEVGTRLEGERAEVGRLRDRLEEMRIEGEKWREMGEGREQAEISLESELARRLEAEEEVERLEGELEEV